ncbi:DUF2750 domain-containing protein [Chitinophaga sp. 212800010-3]|uniref:DUF2750 domain-containing protein n=1 Tax=unclassified Chitinophaga TaxID=2619133 RepID=UPI002DEA0908|nr:DUF2750 domain-containing protein [Chitinophaga sp. 212800010-3]
MKKISQKEIDNVIKLSPFERYQYTIKWIADGEMMYSLAENNNLAIAEIGDKKMLSLWSAAEYAQLSATGEWEGYEVMAISIDRFATEIIDLIDSEGYLLNIFSVGDKSGFIVDIKEFMKDLDDELGKYG